MIAFLLAALLSIILGSLAAADYPFITVLFKISWALCIVLFLFTMVRAFFPRGAEGTKIISISEPARSQNH